MRKILSGEINKIKKQFWGSQYFINRRAGQTNAAHCKSQQGDQRLQYAKPSGLTECLPGPSGPVDFKCNFATGLEGRHSTHRVETAAWAVPPFQGCCGVDPSLFCVRIEPCQTAFPSGCACGFSPRPVQGDQLLAHRPDHQPHHGGRPVCPAK